MTEKCPCGSGKSYDACCGLYHEGECVPATAEALMRSRYSAFVKQQEDYLLATWHVSTRPISLNLEQSPKWNGLEIVSTKHGLESDSEGWVEFIAVCSMDGAIERMHENSRFMKEGGRWFYVEGERQSESVKKVGRNAPCPCGSGLKYKRCCGK